MSAWRSIAAAGLFVFLAAPSKAAPVFSPEQGPILSSATLQAATSGYPSRVYYIRSDTAVYSAVTSDGLAFVPDAGVRLSTGSLPLVDMAISSITGLSVLPLSGGGFRMLYSVTGTTIPYRIYSATSADGLNWVNELGGAKISVNGGQTFAQYPSLIQQPNLPAGYWGLYFIENSAAGNPPSASRVYLAVSTDSGVSFFPPSEVLSAQANQVSAVVLSDNLVRLYYTAPLPLINSTTDDAVISALSTNQNGDAFNVEGPVISTAPASAYLAFPLVLRATDTYRWRLYYNAIPFAFSSSISANVYGALTTSPAPESMTPALAAFTQPGSTFSVSGEIFSPGLSATLQMSGQPSIAGSNIQYSNDLGFSVFFNTQNQAVGSWSLVVTNADGQSGVLSGALQITFPNGSVSLLDNLIRPLQGQKTTITVTTYGAGRVTLKLYTIAGGLVGAIFDGDLSAGTYTFYWDGQNSSSRVVASGVYVLRATGPKLNSIDKIVVIK